LVQPSDTSPTVRPTVRGAEGRAGEAAAAAGLSRRRFIGEKSAAAWKRRFGSADGLSCLRLPWPERALDERNPQPCPRCSKPGNASSAGELKGAELKGAELKAFG